MIDEAERDRKWARVVIPLFLFLASYALWSVECPFCHAGHVDAAGRCSSGDDCRNFYSLPQWNQMSDKEKSLWTGNRGHYRATTCSWCSASGRMNRLSIWMD